MFVLASGMVRMYYGKWYECTMDGWGKLGDAVIVQCCTRTGVHIMAKGTLYTFSANMDGASMQYADGSIDAIQWRELTEEIRAHLMAHGWKQKVADGAAKSRDPETGRSATDGEKISAMRAIAQRLAAGVWAVTGGGGGASSEKMLLIRALAEFSGKSLDDARAFVDGKTKAQQTALAANAKIKSIVDRLRAESVSMVDSDELLDGFMDE